MKVVCGWRQVAPFALAGSILGLVGNECPGWDPDRELKLRVGYYRIPEPAIKWIVCLAGDGHPLAMYEGIQGGGP